MAKTHETTNENDGQITCIKCATKSLADRAEDLACELQEKLRGGASSDQFRLMGHAAIAVAILEAVRALKPDTRVIDELKALNIRNVEHGMVVVRERDELQDEIERLQKKVADQALTIATLKDELGKERRELAATLHLLSEERALTAATVGDKAATY